MSHTSYVSFTKYGKESTCCIGFTGFPPQLCFGMFIHSIFVSLYQSYFYNCVLLSHVNVYICTCSVIIIIVTPTMFIYNYVNSVTMNRVLQINTLFYSLGQIRMNAPLIMENVHITVTIHMEATTVLVIVDMYSLLIKRIVMVRINFVIYIIYNIIVSSEVLKKYHPRAYGPRVIFFQNF